MIVISLCKFQKHPFSVSEIWKNRWLVVLHILHTFFKAWLTLFMKGFAVSRKKKNLHLKIKTIRAPLGRLWWGRDLFSGSPVLTKQLLLQVNECLACVDIIVLGTVRYKPYKQIILLKYATLLQLHIVIANIYLTSYRNSFALPHWNWQRSLSPPQTTLLWI